MTLYLVTTPAQLDLYDGELRAVCATFAPESPDKTVDQLMALLQQYPTQWPWAALWLAIEAGRLVGLMAAKVYEDVERTCSVNWLWVPPSPVAKEVADAGIAAVVAYATEAGCTAIYGTRRTRLNAYARWIGRRGFEYDRVVFRRSLTQCVIRGDHGSREPGNAVGHTDVEEAGRPAAGVGCPDADAPRPADRAPEDADLRADAAGDQQPAERGTVVELRPRWWVGESPEWWRGRGAGTGRLRTG